MSKVTTKQTTKPAAQWASERAAALDGKGKAGARYERLAVALLDAMTSGKPAITFDAINQVTKDHRGVGAADAAARWSSGLSRLRSITGGDASPFVGLRVDAGTQSVVIVELL